MHTHFLPARVDMKLCVLFSVYPCTFGDLYISTVTSQGAVDLSNQLHVVEQRVEAVEVGEADLMRCAAPCNLGKKKKQGHLGANNLHSCT